MQQPIGHSISFRFTSARRWLNLGPGWAAVAGALSSGYADLDLTALLQLISLWILVDPILGTLWELAADYSLLRRATRADLPAPPARGVDLPYAQPGSPAGHLVILLRRYGCWWRDSFWPADKENIVTYGVGMILALVIGLALGPAVFWLVFLTLALTLLAGLARPDLGLFAGGRMQSVTQFLLPWLMGAVLWTEISWLVLVLGLAYWAVYLGGLQLLDKRQRAEWLFYLGQSAATILLLSLRLLPGAVVLAVLLVAQLLTRTKYDNAAELLQRSQAYVVIGLLVASASIGGL